MNARSLLSVGLVLLAGCGVASIDMQSDEDLLDEDLDSTGADLSTPTYTAPTGLATQRVYLGSPNHLTVTDDVPWVYGLFDLLPQGRVLVQLATEKGTTGSVGFKVYRVATTGKLVYLGSFDGATGQAAVILRTTFGGSFVVEAVGNQHPGSLALSLDCLRQDGKCSPKHQPAESCGGFAGFSCDSGLYCKYTAAAICGMADATGTCARKATQCAGSCTVGTTCGCDGKAYCNACDAAALGVSAHATGACSCDGSVYYPAPAATAETVQGSWIWSGERGLWNVFARTLLNADGTYSQEETLNPTCLNSQPACRIASRLLTGDGKFRVEGGKIVLLPSSTSAVDLPTAFAAARNCKGAGRLTTTEGGVQVNYFRMQR